MKLQLCFLALLGTLLIGCSPRLSLQKEKAIRTVKVKTAYSYQIPEEVQSNFDSAFYRKITAYNKKNGYISWQPVPEDSTADLTLQVQTVYVSDARTRAICGVGTLGILGLAIALKAPFAFAVVPATGANLTLSYNPFLLKKAPKFRPEVKLRQPCWYWTSEERQLKRIAKYYGSYSTQWVRKLEYDYLKSQKDDPVVRQYLRKRAEKKFYMGIRLGLGSGNVSQSHPLYSQYKKEASLFASFGLKGTYYFKQKWMASIEMGISGDRGAWYRRKIQESNGMREEEYAMSSTHYDFPLMLGYTFTERKFKPVLYSGLALATFGGSNITYRANTNTRENSEVTTDNQRYRTFQLEALIGGGFHWHFGRCMYFMDFRYRGGIIPLYKDHNSRIRNFEFIVIGFMVGL